MLTQARPFAIPFYGAELAQQPSGPALAQELHDRVVSTLHMLRMGGESFIRPSGPPALLSSLTDYLLVVATDAIKAVASSEVECSTPVTGKDQYRLLAWVMADARGATETLDKALAETVGKRLHRQAMRVREAMENASRVAQASRGLVRLMALGGGEIGAQLEAIDAAERLELEKPRLELYVGFTELESLLPGPLADASEGLSAGSEPQVPQAPKRMRLEDFEATLKAQGISFPFLSYQHYEEKTGAIPPDLVKALGPDATQALRAWTPDSMNLHGEDWWSCGLPHFTKQLLYEKTRNEIYHAEDLEESKECEKMAEARVKEAREDAERQSEEDWSRISALELQQEELRNQLREAKGREDALHAVIHRCRWES